MDFTINKPALGSLSLTYAALWGRLVRTKSYKDRSIFLSGRTVTLCSHRIKLELGLGLGLEFRSDGPKSILLKSCVGRILAEKYKLYIYNTKVYISYTTAFEVLSWFVTKWRSLPQDLNTASQMSAAGCLPTGLSWIVRRQNWSGWALNMGTLVTGRFATLLVRHLDVSLPP